MRDRRGARLASKNHGATVLVFACAASAGAHAGLVPAHLNGEPRLGVAFLVAVVVLAGAAAAVAARPANRLITGAAGLLLTSLIVAYLASRTTGIPVLDPETEALDAVGVATNAVEVIGALAAFSLIHPRSRRGRLTYLQEVPR